MKPSTLFEEFEQIEEELGIHIMQKKGNFNEGYCLLKEKYIIVINKLKPIEQRVHSLSQDFAKLDTLHIYLKPTIRKMIENEGHSLQVSSIN